MSGEIAASIIIALASFVGALVALIKAFRTTPGERADLAAKYEDMASRQAEQIDKLKSRIDAQETLIDQMEKELVKVKDRLNEYQHGVAVLIHQLEANGIPPGWKPKDTGELKK